MKYYHLLPYYDYVASKKQGVIVTSLDRGVLLDDHNPARMVDYPYMSYLNKDGHVRLLVDVPKGYVGRDDEFDGDGFMALKPIPMKYVIEKAYLHGKTPNVIDAVITPSGRFRVFLAANPTTPKSWSVIGVKKPNHIFMIGFFYTKREAQEEFDRADGDPIDAEWPWTPPKTRRL